MGRERSRKLGTGSGGRGRSKVLLVAAEAAVLKSVSNALAADEDFELVGAASSIDEARASLSVVTPDVVVACAKGRDAPVLLQEIGQAFSAPLVAVTDAEVAAKRAGAAATLKATSSLETILRAVRVVHEPAASSGKIRTVAVQEGAPLSTREQQVLRLIAFGHTNREAAAVLEISVKSVETYRARVGGKLGLKSRAEFVRYAMAQGLLDESETKPKD